uniref:Uncharacterized protein n=1 Tax=Wuchereria bancrofti TaxID=6293 RepID=A0AAF5PG25_WUCBA
MNTKNLVIIIRQKRKNFFFRSHSSYC